MQEEVENRTVTLSINTTKMTGRVLKEALRKYLAYQKAKSQGKAYKDVKPTGKQSVKHFSGLIPLPLSLTSISTFSPL